MVPTLLKRIVPAPLKQVVRDVRSAARVARESGVSGLLQRHRRKQRAKSLLSGKIGLEIGGPSWLFSSTGEVPVYPWVGRVDNTNFSKVTVWEGTIEEGMTFVYDKNRPPGRQYLCDATDLRPIPSDAYDFLLSSHTLEHVANPIKALQEWMRVVKVGGIFTVVLPHMEGTFDHKRPITPLAHLVDDFQNGIGEDDLTHLDEILEKHELSRDPGAGDLDSFRRRSRENFRNRCLHQHVFNTPAVLALLDHVGIQVIALDVFRPFHIVTIGKKLPGGTRPDNSPFLGQDAAYRHASPFANDRG